MANKYDFLNKIGLGNVWTNIKNYISSFTYSKTELNTKLDDKANSSDLNNYLPKSGGQVFKGTDFFKSTNSSYLMFCSGSAWGFGGGIALYGKDSSTFGGGVAIKAINNNNYATLNIYPNGKLIFDDNGTIKNIDVIEEQGDGYIRYSNGLQICWGQFEINAGANSTTIFDLPKPFKNTNSFGATINGQILNLYLIGWTSASLIIRNTEIAISVNVKCCAIGYWK